MGVTDPVIFDQTSTTKQNYNESHKLEKVVTGEVTVRKKPLGRKLRDIFIVSDPETVRQYVIFDIIIPGVKRLICDSVEMILLGDTKASKAGRYRDYASYDRGSSKNNRRDFTDRDRSKPDYRDYTFATRSDAEEVLRSLRELIDMYDRASVADFYDLVGQSTDYTENKYGWLNLDRARVMTCRDGYYIELPKAIVIS